MDITDVINSSKNKPQVVVFISNLFLVKDIICAGEKNNTIKCIFSHKLEKSLDQQYGTCS